MGDDELRGRRDPAYEPDDAGELRNEDEPSDEDGVEDTYDDDSVGAPEGKRRSPARIAVYTVLSMLLVVALVLAGFALYLNHLLDSNVRRAGLLPSASRTAKDPAAGDAVNILLLGSDSRTEDLQDSSRADVIQLVHIDSGRSSAQVIHFPRDLYVDIPGKGKNKINAAFAYGGAPLLVQTLERLLGVRVDHVAQIGFDGFKDLTNTVGGVDVNVEQPTTSGGFTFTKGTNHMSGEQALAFVRERKQLGAGDIDRGKRQQAWIQALLAKSLSRGTLTNPAKLTSMIDDTTSNLVVDDQFSTGAMRSLAISLRSLRGGDVTYLTAPFSGFDTVAGVGSIDVVDQPRMTALGTALRTDAMSSYDGRANTPG